MDADLVLYGDVVTMNDSLPRAEGLAVTGGRITAVGPRAEIETLIGTGTRVVDVGSACILPGFIEPHGHPLEEAIVLGPAVVDIRPVTIADADAVVAAITDTVADRGAAGAALNGWDPLLQKGLPEPTLEWLDTVAPDHPLVILHNSGHVAYFNTAAAAQAGITRDTHDPVGGSYGHDASGALDGTAYETPAVFTVAGHAMTIGDDFPALLAAECARLNAAGITTVAEMSFDPRMRPALKAIADAGLLTTRFRLYEMSTPARTTEAAPGDGNDLVRQIGIKVWSDGSPWVGNIATSFPYLDTEATRGLGIACTHGHANYTGEQIHDISAAYFDKGWQIACHAHGDDAITMVLDAWEQLLREYPRPDHRLRLEHVGAMRPDQFQRAADLGVTVSIFIDHLHYWGDVLVDDLFGPEHGSVWAAAGSALAAGQRFTFHNDGPVTPANPLRNMQDAVTRLSPSGRVIAPQERIPVDAALRAHTVNAAWQLFSEEHLGAIFPGAYADLVVLSANPLDTEPTSLSDLKIRATMLEGRTVYGELSAIG
ncbi:amidohydrolase [Rhodococcus sp. IEGM 1379]|uniref:amidohydrolase n=1 Tax=Rhodococcus sp. IEGM 1379 TaxID=3047086 RepID=UPI0024B6B9AB|nr:amidohydrolase [Rhodococcus sp. IEGM 1379]MDI9916193.1 amidohydrolase [Rhodococcus sp. IEGM 1379]